MTTFSAQITIDNPNHLILSNLPFEPGQQVNIVISSVNPGLQALARLKALTEDLPVADPVALVREGRDELEERNIV
jgi:hypothetical protein